MKRLVRIALVCLTLFCAGGTVLTLAYIQAGVGELPVYPGAQNVQRGGVVSVNTFVGTGGIYSYGVPGQDTLKFETAARAVSVYDFYENWLSSHSWKVSRNSGGISMPGGPELSAHKVGSPDLHDVRFLGFNGSIIPQFDVPQHLYIALVRVDGSGQNSRVTIDVIQTEGW